ncbi:hypothetical protein BACCAP_00460 [Pseudoflavonifractor capillosus ATCC 29799]|uniref:Uncharacterized protein n=1 Tax=Pseudoflavonifractor capillosus ATCC 29799 TaxID=411467 RepID=A6NQJ0_9FIRM|nr:hypothetical protein BACCAP_00460 [Pseudoflavonifractor capillosus ATCC 29799]
MSARAGSRPVCVNTVSCNGYISVTFQKMFFIFISFCILAFQNSVPMLSAYPFYRQYFLVNKQNTLFLFNSSS